MILEDQLNIYNISWKCISRGLNDSFAYIFLLLWNYSYFSGFLKRIDIKEFKEIEE
jgi:hypothetical protein